jgi:alpha-beta hydrolase superfamily lysophospholipase
MIRSVLYFHGFASSPSSQKVEAIHRLVEPAGLELNTPDLNVPSFERLDWNALVERAVSAGRSKAPAVVVGSSLGALVALEVVRQGIAAPLVLIAPAIGVADQWLKRLPPGDPIRVFNHALGAEAPIHRKFFEQVSRVDVDREPPAVPVTILMGRQDESVPFDRVEGTWARWQASGKLHERSKFVAIDEGDHGLVAFVDAISREILAAAGGN